MVETITKITEKYLKEHPSVKDCLKKGVINYSKLARKIVIDLRLGKKVNMEAILIACRRYAEKLKKEEELEKKIRGILKKSEMEIKNKIVVVIVNKKIYMDNLLDIEKKLRKKTETFYAIEGTGVFTLILSDKYLDEINELFGRNIVKVSRDLAMITLKSSIEIEYVPGVIAYLYSLFSENGININHQMSCWTDTIFIIDDRDVGRVVSFLKF